MQFITLKNGVAMPMSGFGVFQVKDLVVCEQVVKDAISVGYRLIDTAASYFNEEAVGKAIQSSDVAREELFITTKLWVQDAGYENTKKAFETSMKNLQLEYLDLYLIHQPFGDYYGSWRAMEDLYEEGRIRAIGVSNFYEDRLADLCLNAKIPPMVNQIELHPFHQQSPALEVMKEFEVCPEAWGPFAEGNYGIFTNEILLAIAQKYNKTVAQVILRWNIQRGVVVIPKSTKKERMKENFAIWDFFLTEEDMQSIRQLDTGRSEIIVHDNAEAAKRLNSWKIHE